VNLPISEQLQLALPTRADEESLLSTIRIRAEQAVYPARIEWQRCERSAERDDLRTRLALPRAVFDRLPSGCPWRGRVVTGRWMPRTVSGMTIGLAASWLDLAAGGSGAITAAQTMDWYHREQALWQQQYGSLLFVAAVAGTFVEPFAVSPLPNLALLSWTDGEWRMGEGPDAEADLAPLFFPKTPAECAAQVEAQLDRSPNFPRLLSEIAAELHLPETVVMPADGKNLGSYALEYRSGHHLFYRR